MDSTWGSSPTGSTSSFSSLFALKLSVETGFWMLSFDDLLECSDRKAEITNCTSLVAREARRMVCTVLCERMCVLTYFYQSETACTTDRTMSTGRPIKLPADKQPAPTIFRHIQEHTRKSERSLHPNAFLSTDNDTRR
jgi:hypothetical protein